MVHPANWNLAIADIAKGKGVATVTLKSGAQLSGRPDRDLSDDDTVFLHTDRGWHVIDVGEVAAISGEPRQ